jgi:transcriptional regulator NrdR family protein
MKCPINECGRKIQVSDSREREGGRIVKRRRRCNHCQKTWTTCETIQPDQTCISNIHINKQNVTPFEIYNEILQLLGALAKSIGLVKTPL